MAEDMIGYPLAHLFAVVMDDDPAALRAIASEMGPFYQPDGILSCRLLGADDKPFGYSMSLLQLAALEGRANVVRELLSTGASADCLPRIDDEDLPKNGHPFECFQKTMHEGAPYGRLYDHDPARTPLMLALRWCEPGRQLCFRGDAFRRDKVAKAAIARMLLAEGASTLKMDSECKTPLHYAIQFGDEKLIEEIAAKSVYSVRGNDDIIMHAIDCGATENTTGILELHASAVFDPRNLTDTKDNGERLFYTKEARARAAAEDSVDHRRCARCRTDLAEMEKRKKCGRCKRCLYCGPACQKNDWKFHKLCCKA